MNQPLHPKITEDISLGNHLSSLYAHINAATYSFLEKLREFDQRGAYGTFDCKSTALWLNWQCGVGLVAAREKVRVANALGNLPLIKDTFRQGRLSYSKVRAMTRVATPASEGALLNIAQHATASQTERAMRHHAQALKVTEPKLFANREFTYWWDNDGALVFKGRLTAEQGAVFLKALDQTAELNSDIVATDDAVDSFAARRADALAVLVEQGKQNHNTTDPVADRFQVMVHVAASTLASGKINPNDPPELEQGPVIDVKTAERLSCDAAIIPLLETKEGEPLKIGRKTRSVPIALRRALKRRDKGCRFPGCDHTHYVDAHHIQHWAKGGETSLDNLVLLCRYHHRQLHEGGCRIEGRGVNLQFFNKQDALIPQSAEDHTQGNADTLLKNASAEAFLDYRSLTPLTYEARPDYDAIAGALSQYVEREPL